MITAGIDGGEAAAAAAFSRWAALQAGAPADVSSHVRGVERTEVFIGLLATEIEGRRAVWREVPASSRLRTSYPSLSIADVDAWSAAQAPVRDRSDHIALCGTCAGEKKVVCDRCNGSGKLLCGGCGGRRKAYGYASNGSYRLLNCTACRGKGDVDCVHCRRGFATCLPCTGEGRVQRWIELESWRRSVSRAHPDTLARQLVWTDDPANGTVLRDAYPAVDVDRPHRLLAGDLGSTPSSWVESLAPPLQTDERVVRQRLRIARLPVYTVAYTLGRDEDRATFVGCLLKPPEEGTPTAFARRAARLRSARRVLSTAAVCAAIVSFGRGAFYLSASTALSVGAFIAALAASYGALAASTSNRRPRRWLIAGAAFLLFAFVLAAAGLPRVGHAERLITTDRLDRAELELSALGSDASITAWADLRLARLEQTADLEVARGLLEQIPPTIPQHAKAAAMVDRLILRISKAAAGLHEWQRGLSALAFLSDRARGQPEAAEAATATAVPLTQQQIAREEWAGAASTIVAARGAGVAPATLEPLASSIRAAAESKVVAAKRADDPRERLGQRIAAEAMLVAWERATDTSNTPALIALRTAMARDVASLERAARRRRSS